MKYNDYIHKKIDDWQQAQKHGCMCLVSKVPLCFYCSNNFGATLDEHIERYTQIWRDLYLDSHGDYDRAMKDLF